MIRMPSRVGVGADVSQTHTCSCGARSAALAIKGSSESVHICQCDGRKRIIYQLLTCLLEVYRTRGRTFDIQGSHLLHDDVGWCTIFRIIKIKLKWVSLTGALSRDPDSSRQCCSAEYTHTYIAIGPRDQSDSSPLASTFSVLSAGNNRGCIMVIYLLAGHTLALASLSEVI